ncbi:MAG: flagellar biosynthetic protein FliR [Burkholderiaceae bacterium]|jgi:flagellar biosynthetic protein FliR
MMHFTEAELLTWLAAWFYPLCRIAALVGTAPIFSDSSMPVRIKIALAILVTIVVAPSLGPPPTTAILSFDGGLLIARQIIIGAAMGIGMRFAFYAVQYAGDLAGTQMGLGFAQLFDPQNNQESAVVGTFLTYLAYLVFLSLNGHLMMIAAITESFNSLPLVSPHGLGTDWQELVLHGSVIFSLGLYLALPVVAASLLANVVMGVMMRAAPQMNLFAIGFPITLLIGLGTLLLALPMTLPMVERTLTESFATLLHYG